MKQGLLDSVTHHKDKLLTDLGKAKHQVKDANQLLELTQAEVLISQAGAISERLYVIDKEIRFQEDCLHDNKTPASFKKNGLKEFNLSFAREKKVIKEIDDFLRKPLKLVAEKHKRVMKHFREDLKETGVERFEALLVGGGVVSALFGATIGAETSIGALLGALFGLISAAVLASVVTLLAVGVDASTSASWELEDITYRLQPNSW